MTIRLIYPVANDPKGAVIVVDDRRAKRLIRTGYAVACPSHERPEPTRERPRKGERTY